MTIRILTLASAAVAATLITGAAFAQTTTGGEVVQRDINQQQRIENGLKSGQLSVKEAAGLEKQESRIDRVESQDLKRGPLTAQESAQINRMQNKVSGEIYADKHNGVTGNPNSQSSRRMQADVQRNVNQEQRIENGVQNGSLNDRQVGRLEGGQARVDRAEYRAGRDGHVSAGEQHHIQHMENVQSRHIHHAKTSG